MTLVDSVGWIEFFTNGPLASKYEKHLEPLNKIVVPAIVLYEVYKKIKMSVDEDHAVEAITLMNYANVIPLTGNLSLVAADLSIQHKLAMADAIVYATTLGEKAKLVTSDSDLKDLPGVIYYEKKK